MENKDTKTDYQEVVRLGDQKWEMEMVEITVCDSYSLFLYIQGIFKPHLKKVTYNQSASSYPKSQYDLSPYYIVGGLSQISEGLYI